MRCLHVRQSGVCLQETELRCSHCDAPRCTNHGVKVSGKFLCLSAARVALGLSPSEPAASN
jgi:hypothetical protein